MFCMNCGSDNPSSAKFCSKCGYPLDGGSGFDTTTKKTGKNGRSGSSKKKWKKILTRFLICLVVYMVFYTAAYLITSWSKNKSDRKTDSHSAVLATDSFIQVQPTADTGYTVNVYADHWNDVRIWAWSDAGDLFDAWPGEKMQDDGYGWYSYEVPDWVDNVVINAEGGSVKTPDISLAPQESWIIVYTDNGASVTYLDPATVKDPWANSQILEPVSAETTPPATYAAPVELDGYIAELDGWWERVHLEDGNNSLNVSALCFDQTIYNCTGFTLTMDVTMNAGTSCKNWQVWGRSGNTFVKLTQIYLPAGDGYLSEEIKFRSPVNFDAIAVTPTIAGGYSWSMGLGISDVWTK